MKLLTYADLSTLGQVRLIHEGKNEIVPAYDAWRQAESIALNLVQVSDEGTVPAVVRIQDFNKLMFEKKKVKHGQKKKKKSELKEIQLKANISMHDLETKVRNIDKFLERGDKVKVVIRLKGREKEHPQRADELMVRLVELVKAPNKFSKVPGPVAIGLLEPSK